MIEVTIDKTDLCNSHYLVLDDTLIKKSNIKNISVAHIQWTKNSNKIYFRK